MKPKTGIEVYGLDEVDEELGLGESDDDVLGSEGSEFEDDDQDIMEMPDSDEEEQKKKKKKGKRPVEEENDESESSEEDELYEKRTAWGKDFYGGQDALDGDAEDSQGSEDEKAHEAEAIYLQ